ncbi:MAG TPA: cbb3-type cytochrome c oxidase subunit I [Ignavibacteriales bacterium]|nr:cbb3-type cytochrome c oxidase subunit I [Ignavibacteriales bacterium]
MLEFTKKPGSSALAFLMAGSVWFVIGTLYGMVSAIHLVAPEFFNNIPALTFGRERPIHINTVVYGFIINTLIGSGMYYVPALLRVKLFSEPMGWVSFFLWNIAVLSGPLTFSFGITQGREYSEYIWIFDVAILLSVLLILYNILMTIKFRREDSLYVSVWYFVATFLWTAGSYTLGNVMWHPKTGALAGLIDSIFLWLWGHNLPGLLLTPLAVGAAYYVIPRITKTPLYSHALSLIGFWTLVAFYSHIGGHHLMQAPIPAWFKAMSAIDSALMFIPVMTAIVNLWLSSRGHANSIIKDPAGRWVMMGIIWYLIVGIQGSIQSFAQVQRVTHFNNWTVGHAHIAVLGFSGFIALGAMWHVLPLIVKRKIYSWNLVNLQFGLVMIGLTGFFAVLTSAGLLQGSSWYKGDPVQKVLPVLPVYMAIRAAFGVFIIAGSFVGLYNSIMTLRKGEIAEPPVLVEEEEAVL